jgi:hypothetical protein
MWIFFFLSILSLPLLGSVAAGHRTIRFLFLFSGRFTFFWFFPGEMKFLTTFWQLFWQLLWQFFDNFLTTFWQLFDNFLTTWQLPQQILWNKFHIRCAYFTPNCSWSLNYSVLVSSYFESHGVRHPHKDCEYGLFTLVRLNCKQKLY